LARDLLQNAEQFDRAAARQVELGARAGIDQTHATIEVARSRQQVAQAEAEVAVALAGLNTSMGRNPTEAVGEVSPFKASAQPIDREQAIKTALDARSEVAEDAALVSEARAEANLARAEGRPDIAPQFRAERITRGVEGVGVGLAITLPLLDHGSRRSRIRQAEETARAQLDRSNATRNQIRQEVTQAIARAQAAEAVVKSYQEGLLDQARRLLDASRVGFQAGATNILALLEAQRSYRAVNAEHINALAALALAHVELERAMGTAPVQLPRKSE
jgi:cobalt-zinc-cadmium efflux system outer membrane protein